MDDNVNGAILQPLQQRLNILPTDSCFQPATFFEGGEVSASSDCARDFDSCKMWPESKLFPRRIEDQINSGNTRIQIRIIYHPYFFIKNVNTKNYKIIVLPLVKLSLWPQNSAVEKTVPEEELTHK